MSTKISGMSAFSSPVLASDFLPVLHMPGGVPDATGPQRASLSQIRTAFLPVSLATEVTGVLPVTSLAPSGTNGWVLTTTGGVPVWAAPSGGGTTPTGTGFTHITGGTQDGAAKKVDLTAAADVTVPTTVGGIIVSNGTALAQPTNVSATNGAINVGGTTASSGALNLAQVSSIKSIRGGVDYNVLDISLGSFINIGDSAGSEFISARPGSGGIFRVLTGASAFEGFTVTETQVQAGFPIVGLANNSSPYGAHGMTVKAMAGATSTLTAAEYQNYTVKVTGTGTNVIKFPAATDAAGYTKYVWNAGSGTLAVQDTNSVAAAATLAAGTGAVFQFAASAVKQLTAAFAVA